MEKQRTTSTSDFNNEIGLKGFKAYEIDSKTGKGHAYSRKDFYKIGLLWYFISKTVNEI